MWDRKELFDTNRKQDDKSLYMSRYIVHPGATS